MSESSSAPIPINPLDDLNSHAQGAVPNDSRILAAGTTLSVVIPAYNESKRIIQTFREIRTWLDSHAAESYEVVVVDDGSRDDTAAIIEKEMLQWPQLRLIRQPRNLGKGAAVRRGCLAAMHDFVLFMDADHATPIDELRGFLPKMAQGFDIVVGVRTFQENESHSRRTMGLGLLMLAHLIVFRKVVVDSQCGFKLFRRSACQNIFSRCRIDGGMIDVEVFHIIHRLGLRVWYAPVHWDNKAGSTINILRCILFDPFDLIAIRIRGTGRIYDSPIERQPWDEKTKAASTAKLI